MGISVGNTMFNEAELQVVSSLGDVELPRVILDQPSIQLKMLAHCYYGEIPPWYSSHLCSRIADLNSFASIDKHILRQRISDSINARPSLTIYMDDCFPNAHIDRRCRKDLNLRLALRDIWIKQILLKYGTTVYQQLDSEYV